MARHYKRRSFATSELAKIFDPQSYAKWATEALLWWAPMLGLHMGLRASEAPFISLDDVVEQDGVICIVLVDKHARPLNGSNGEGLRNRRRKRAWTVPMPQALLDMGFAAYVAAARHDGEHLIFISELGASTRPPGAGIRSQFARYLRLQGIEMRNFSSLPQTFGEALSRSEINSDDLSDLLRNSKLELKLAKRFFPVKPRMFELKSIVTPLQRTQYPRACTQEARC